MAFGYNTETCTFDPLVSREQKTLDDGNRKTIVLKKATRIDLSTNHERIVVLAQESSLTHTVISSLVGSGGSRILSFLEEKTVTHVEVRELFEGYEKNPTKVIEALDSGELAEALDKLRQKSE